MKIMLKSLAIAIVLSAVVVLTVVIAVKSQRGKSDTAKGTSAEQFKFAASTSGPEMCSDDNWVTSWPVRSPGQCFPEDKYKDLSDVDDLRVISHDANQLCLAQNAKGKLEKPEWDTCLGILKLREQIAMRDAQAALNRGPK